ncbi:MAG: ribosome maturation factor RimM [Defluviitaleaceae bacterium]|nr:ribosome maturation factor RimM [Defluviitaleaceae bacterium]
MNDFEIGIITKAQGIRGEFRVLPTTDDPSRFELLVGEEIKVNGKPHKLVSARMQKNIVILKLADVNDRNTAEAMINAVISIPAEKSLPLASDEFYIRDLIGLHAQTEGGEPIGTLTHVMHTGANDVYVITLPEGESFMLPAVKDVVKNVDIPSKKITIRLLEGLRDLAT